MSWVDWVALGVFGVLVLGAISIVADGIKDRRQAIKNGGQAGSLFWHIQQRSRTEKEARKARRADGVSTPSSLDQTVSSNHDAAREAVSSKAWKRKAQRARDRDREQQPKVGKITASTSSVPPFDTEDDDELSRELALGADGRLSFLYADASGNETHRNVTNWRFDGTYIKGFCLENDAMRTFRRDRVVEFFEGSEALLYHGTRPASAVGIPAAEPSNATNSGREWEILFTGFDAKTKATLEKTAKYHGFCVRKTVTKNLDFLCAGPRYSRTKHEKASQRSSCRVIDKDGFMWMLTTGEVNE
ncbi:hypothetical protein R5R73_01250 [Salinicola sp. LHM]|uniref:hypothetical protein n=1 Tax=Salinicola sp. LHM TaxID=3065298 RepID=UPI002ACEF555|nr:hypothetical protein [Salinicola sp. LHM]WQH33353.1 hypothetical protein R5R73_01250 [Salinicola sp. LHM]